MKKDSLKLSWLFIRYLIILLAGLFNLYIFYSVFGYLTIAIVSFFARHFFNPYIFGNLIIFKDISIRIIPACVAGSAYYLLFILCLSVSDIKIIPRLKLLLFSFFGFFVFNIARIFILVLSNNSVYFNEIHLFFWYFLSTVFVVLIWIFDIYYFKIKDIPIYSDILYLISVVKNSRKKSKRRK